MSDRTFRQVIREAVSESDLGLRDRVKLRLVLRFREAALQQEIFNQAQVEGLIPVAAAIDDHAGGEVAAIDWEGLAAFIKEVLPAILQIIQLWL